MALHKDSCVLLNDGHKMPVIGFGTYAPEKDPKSLAEEGTKVAIDVGYRHIDSAFIYGNEVEVGRAIKEKIADGTVKREDVFYTGKLWSTFQAPNLVRPALEKSLKDLQMDYMDLFIIHSPIELRPGDDPFPKDENGKVIFHNTDIRDTWKAMEECKDAGLVKSIGVSNFNRRQLELILNMPGLKYKPVCNQVECHIYLNQRKLLEFCKSQDIVLVGYSVLGSSRDEKWIDPNSPVLLEDPVLNTIAQKLSRTPAQVALRYLLQQGIVVLAKSFTPARIKQNFQIFDFELSAEDMKTLDGLNKNTRYVDITMFKDHPKFPYHDEYITEMDLGTESCVVMNDGHKIPRIGFGTYAPEKFPKSMAEEATKVAIDIGYRHIDCAFVYGNEAEVGRAIREKIEDGTVRRQDLFFTGKLWCTYHVPQLVLPALKRSLVNLHLDYMDLFLIHMPMALKPGEDLMPVDENGRFVYHNTDLRDTWEAMEMCKDSGLVRSIGVSNFNRRQLELILNKPGLKYKPVCNQVECHIYLNQSQLLEFCVSQDIILVGYGMLGSSRHEKWIDQTLPVLLEDPVLNSIAKKHRKSPAQVALRYFLQLGVVVLAKSFNPERIKENFQIFDFQLPPEDIKKLEALNRNLRYIEAKQ
ncbi:aldo-keto reductase family 1 member C1-like [Rhinophrynus dorsalis]